jgi:hypothetical protein
MNKRTTIIELIDGEPYQTLLFQAFEKTVTEYMQLGIKGKVTLDISGGRLNCFFINAQVAGATQVLHQMSRN